MKRKPLQWSVLTTSCFLLLIASTVSGECVNGSRVSFERSIGVALPPSAEFVLQTADANDSCRSQCENSTTCSAFFLDHQRLTCSLLTQAPDQLLPWPHGSYFRKICLPPGVSCWSRHWAFDRVWGMELAGEDDVVLESVLSSEQCAYSCLQRPQLPCRSAEYDGERRTCVLSKNDRRSRWANYQPTNRSLDYLENQCNIVPKKCVFSPRPEGQLLFPLWTTGANSRHQCQQQCSQHKAFQCRSLAFHQDTGNCQLSADDKFSLPPHLLNATSSSPSPGQYYERTNCLHVAMKCDAHSMTALVTLEHPFQGRVYALHNPNECLATAQSPPNDHQVALLLPIKSPICGTKSMGDGFYSNSIIVQHHPHVIRATDRRIDVVCEYVEHRIRLKAGKHIAESDEANESSVVTGVAPTPQVRLRLVDQFGNEVDGVELGTRLLLKVELMDQRIYGILGSGLVASSGDGSENMTLIDHFGCPIDSSIFPVLSVSSGSKSLQAPFQAFRFASDSRVHFQLVISFCLDQCQPAECDSEEASYGRRRRRRSFSSQLPDVIMESSLLVTGTLERKRHSSQLADENIEVVVKTAKECASPLVVIILGLLAALLQLVVIFICAYLVRGRHGPVMASPWLHPPPSTPSQATCSSTKF